MDAPAYTRHHHRGRQARSCLLVFDAEVEAEAEGEDDAYPQHRVGALCITLFYTTQFVVVSLAIDFALTMGPLLRRGGRQGICDP